MIVTSIDDVTGTDREVRCPQGGFTSFRLLLAKDGMGFSLHKTVIPKNPVPQHWHYKYHLEACFCVSGRGQLTRLSDRKTWDVGPGVLYALNDHDDHTFLAVEDTILISVFNPPVTGIEVHQADGSYTESVI